MSASSIPPPYRPIPEPFYPLAQDTSIDEDNIAALMKDAQSTKNKQLLEKCLLYLKDITHIDLSCRQSSDNWFSDENESRLTTDIKIKEENSDEDLVNLTRYMPMLIDSSLGNKISVMVETGEKITVPVLSALLEITGDFVGILVLQNLSFTDQELKTVLSFCPNVGYLTFKSCGVTGNGLQEISSLTKLHILNIVKCHGDLTDLTLSNIEGLGSLNIENCSALRTVNLKNCPDVHFVVVHECDSVISYKVEDFRSLATFNILKCKAITQITAENCPELCQMEIKDCESLKSCNFESVTKLDWLVIMNCTNFRSLLIGENSPIKSLYLIGCKAFTDASQLTHAKSLVRLSLNGCENLTVLPEISLLLKLEELHIFGYNAPTLMIGNSSSLKELELENCNVQNLYLENLSRIANLKITHSTISNGVHISHLSVLQQVTFEFCKDLQTVQITHCPLLGSITVSNCNSFVAVDLPTGLGKLSLLKANYEQYDLNNKLYGLSNNLTPIRLRLILLKFIDGYHAFRWGEISFDKVVKAVNEVATRERTIETWMECYSSTIMASSSTPTSVEMVPSPTLAKLFNDYRQLIDQQEASLPKELAWLRYVFFRLSILEENASQWLLEKDVLPNIQSYRNPLARLLITEECFRIAEDPASREAIDTPETLIKLKGKYQQLKSLFPYLVVGLKKKGVDESTINELGEFLKCANTSQLRDRANFAPFFSMLTSFFFLHALNESHIKNVVKALNSKPLSSRTLPKRCSNVLTLIDFKEFERLDNPKLDLQQAVDDAFKTQLGIDLPNLTELYQDTFAKWRNPYGIMTYTAQVQSLDQPHYNVYLKNITLAILTGTLPQFRYNLETNPDLKEIHRISPDFMHRWSHCTEFPPMVWKPENPKAIVPLNPQEWLHEKLVTFNHITNKEASQYILQYLNGDAEVRENISQLVNSKLHDNPSNKILAVQSLCIQLYQSKTKDESKQLLAELSNAVKYQPHFEIFEGDIKNAKKEGYRGGKKFYIYITDHPADLLNIGEMGGSCQRIGGTPRHNIGVCGTVAKGKHLAIVMKEHVGDGNKSLSRKLLRAIPNQTEIVVHAEGLYDDTRLQGIIPAFNKYLLAYVQWLDNTRAVLVDGNSNGVSYGPIQSLSSNIPEYVDSVDGSHIVFGNYTIPRSFRVVV